MISPKIKAKRLVDKYEEHLFGRFTTDMDYVQCVGCAILEVESILELLKHDLDHDPIAQEYYKWYKRVNKELKKL